MPLSKLQEKNKKYAPREAGECEGRKEQCFVTALCLAVLLTGGSSKAN